MAEKMTFEKAMEKLEKAVKDLEQGDLALEKAFKKYEEGMKYSKYCQELLNRTEEKISLLTKNTGGEVEEIPYDKENE